MPIDKDELKKLSPEERIKKLKELEGERKKEMEEASELIKKTEAEIEREKDIPDMDFPEINPVDISRLFEPPEGLEGTVSKAAPVEEEPSSIKYTPAMEQGEGVLYNPPPNEHDLAELHLPRTTEESVKYESVAQQAEDLDATRSVLKKIKKYTLG